MKNRKFIKRIKVIVLVLFWGISAVYEYTFAYLYILNDSCIMKLYDEAKECLKDDEIEVIKSPQGIIIRFELPSPKSEIKYVTQRTYSKIEKIKLFLAKSKNPAIIEVHTENLQTDDLDLKNWEVSTIIANNIERVMKTANGGIPSVDINSVGYGEFLPSAKNTSNNGVNLPNRVDIMVLCNVTGE